MFIILLVFFTNGYPQLIQVDSLEECHKQGNELVKSHTINGYGCAKVKEVTYDRK